MPLFVLGDGVETGAHLASLTAVSEGKAEIAAIDAVTWKLMKSMNLLPPNLRVLAQSPATPGLPLITRKGQDAAQILDLIKSVLQQSSAAKTIGIHDIIPFSREDYQTTMGLNPTHRLG